MADQAVIDPTTDTPPEEPTPATPDDTSVNEPEPDVEPDGEPEPPAPTNVVAAIAAIMRDLPGIGRNDKSEQGYQYRGIEAITRETQRLMGKYGVVFAPHVLSRATKDFTINNKPWTEEQLEISYTVYGPGGIADCIEVGPFWGLGRDNSDKGANKAETQAYKYALVQVFNIGDGAHDADSDIAREADAPPTMEEGERYVPKRIPEGDRWYYAWGWESQADHDETVGKLKASVADASETVQGLVRDWRKANNVGWHAFKRAEYDALVEAIGDGADTTAAQPPAPASPPPASEPPAPATPPEPAAPPVPPDEAPFDAPSEATAPDPDQPPDYTDACIATVKAMKKADLVTTLAELGESTSGNTDALGARLVRRWLADGWTPPQPTLA